MNMFFNNVLYLRCHYKSSYDGILALMGDDKFWDDRSNEYYTARQDEITEKDEDNLTIVMTNYYEEKDVIHKTPRQAAEIDN